MLRRKPRKLPLLLLVTLNDLTNGQGTQLGRVEADAVQVGVGECGI